MKRVLMVVDEPLVRSLIRNVLTRDGYSVAEAGDCLKPESPDTCPLNCCSADGAPDLIVIEVILPRHCSGIEAAHKALERWPAARILFTSASSRDCWPQDSIDALSRIPQHKYALIPKPFTATQLTEAAGRLLASRR